MENRMKFEFRRHSLKDAVGGKRIGPEGMKLARKIGATELRGRGFTHFYVSPRWRTLQTLVAFDEGAGDFDRLTKAPTYGPFYSQHPDLPQYYPLWHQAESGGRDMVNVAFTEHSEIVGVVSKMEADLFRSWATSHRMGDHILVVGHSPEMEFLVYGLLGLQISQLACCRGFQLSVFSDGRIVFES